ncbi:MAG TPA: hypothetical protein VMT46_12485 [Anaerolineaceae bacterium]|nr:hypothetical protein [Anaerolineaceae bacterium]
MSEISIEQETPETTETAAPPRQFPIWLAWALAGVLVLGALNPALRYAQQALVQSLKLSTQLGNTLQLLFWALTSLALGFVTGRILGKRISDPQMWLALVSGAWLLVGLHPSYSLFYSVVQNSNQYPDLGAYRLGAFVINNLVSMGAFAFAGWLVLRMNYRQAGYWILWSVVGAGVAYGLYYLVLTNFDRPGTPVASFLNTEPGSLTLNAIYYLISFAISGLGLQRLLQRPREDFQVERLKWKTFLALWVFALVVGTAANDIFSSNGIQAWLLNTFHYPQWADAAVGGLIKGLILGLAGWLALNDYLPKAGYWMAAAALGETISQAVRPELYSRFQLSLSSLFWVSLAIELFGALVIAILQAGALYLMKVRRAAFWIPIAFAIELVSYPITFYVNQKMGVLVWALLTGLGLVFLARGGLGVLWIARRVGEAKTAGDLEEALEDDCQVLTERLYLALESRPRVLVEEGHLKVFPNKKVEDDLLEWLLSERGAAALVALPEPPLEGSPLPADAPVILSEEDFSSANREESSEEGREKLRIGLEENGVQALDKYLEQNPEARLYLAVDGELVTSQPAEREDSALVWDNLDSSDTFLYTALLAEPALSTAYTAAFVEEGP